MHVQFHINDNTTNDQCRAFAAFLLTLTGDLNKVDGGEAAGALPAAAAAAAGPVVIPPPPARPADSIPSAEQRAVASQLPPPPPPTDAAAGIPPPPPAAVGAAPAAPAAASVPQVEVERDSAGLPWDERIHQKTRGKKKDGTWKIQKGIDAAVVQAVVTELAGQRLAAPVAVTAATAPIFPAPPGSPPSAPGPTPAGVTFRDFMAKVSKLTVDGVLTPLQVSTFVQKHGAQNLGALLSRADLIPAINADIDLHLATLAGG